MRAFIIDPKGVTAKLDQKYFGKMKQNINEIERNVVKTFLVGVGREVISDMTSRIRWNIDPDGRRQKQNSTFWQQQKQAEGVKPNVPLHHTGRLINPRNYTMNIQRGFVAINPPPDRVRVVQDLQARGYSLFYLPNNIDRLINQAADKLTPEDWFGMVGIFSVR